MRSLLIISWLLLSLCTCSETPIKVSIFDLCYRSHLRYLLGVTRELSLRPNVEVTFITNSGCEDYVRSFGYNIELVTIPSPVDQLPPPDDFWELGYYMSEIYKPMVEYYIEKWKTPENRPDIILNDFFMVAANDLAEIYNITLIGFSPNAHCYQFVSDSTFMTEYNSFSTIFDVYPALDSTWYRAYKYLINKWYYFKVDRDLVEGRNKAREAYGLAPLRQFNENSAERPYLVFLEGSFDFVEPRLMPPFIHLAGPLLLHDVRNPNSPDIKEWIDSSEKFIFISFGTLIEFSQEQTEVFHEFMKDSEYKFLVVSHAFSSDLKNVKVEGFVNQIEVLESPSLVAFISHGGQGSVTEAIMSLIPVICLPQGKDQFFLCDRVQAIGIGEMIKPNAITVGNLQKAVSDISSNHNYKAALRKQKLIMKSYQGEERIADLVLMYAEVGYEHLIPKWYRLPWYKKNEFDILVLYGVSVFLVIKALQYCCCKRKLKLD